MIDAGLKVLEMTGVWGFVVVALVVVFLFIKIHFFKWFLKKLDELFDRNEKKIEGKDKVIIELNEKFDKKIEERDKLILDQNKEFLQTMNKYSNVVEDLANSVKTLAQDVHQIKKKINIV